MVTEQEIKEMEKTPTFWKMIFEFGREKISDPENGWIIKVGWKGVYDDYIQSLPWKDKAREARERAGNRCQLCNSPDNLRVHHRTYERLGNELPRDLIVLCDDCHAIFHDKLPRP